MILFSSEHCMRLKHKVSRTQKWHLVIWTRESKIVGSQWKRTHNLTFENKRQLRRYASCRSISNCGKFTHINRLNSLTCFQVSIHFSLRLAYIKQIPNLPLYLCLICNRKQLYVPTYIDPVSPILVKIHICYHFFGLLLVNFKSKGSHCSSYAISLYLSTVRKI